jgi:hypothetical protein
LSEHKIEFICATCGSNDIEKDANVYWNTDLQKWDIASIYGEAYCRNCGCERNIKEKELLDVMDNGGHRVGWALSGYVLYGGTGGG